VETIRIRNWDKWQSWRKDRGTPPWIKVHRRLMHDANWVELTDAQRGQLVAIWMLAAERDGVIPASPATIQKICHMDTEPDLQVFADKGFLELGAKVTPLRRQGDAPETEEKRIETEERRTRATTNGYGWARKVIKLNQGDYSEWKRIFPHLDLDAELVARDAWLADQPLGVQKNWFGSTSQLFNKRNTHARIMGQQKNGSGGPSPPDVHYVGGHKIEAVKL
jgi:hypothetical protein